MSYMTKIQLCTKNKFKTLNKSLLVKKKKKYLKKNSKVQAK